MSRYFKVQNAKCKMESLKDSNHLIILNFTFYILHFELTIFLLDSWFTIYFCTQVLSSF
jgi:hypothetical protein